MSLTAMTTWLCIVFLAASINANIPSSYMIAQTHKFTHKYESYHNSPFKFGQLHNYQ